MSEAEALNELVNSIEKLRLTMCIMFPVIVFLLIWLATGNKNKE